ncbi:MAG TPA: HAD-IA family hydrolase [Alphaproteobacteria bacterium]|nr:HAD-IA family hydrolase [Alphaproteobacteria bacterium]
MPRLQGLIFDLDGTLVDSAPDLRQALNAMLEGHGRRTVGLDETKRMVGDGMIPLVTRAFEATGGVPENFDSYTAAKIFIDHYRGLPADPVQIYPGAREALEGFCRSGIPLGICTNKQESATLRLLQELDLVRCFVFVAGGDTFPVHKPNPGHVTGVMEKLPASAEGCVMIGDSPNDVLAAHGAGIPCIAVTHGYGMEMEKIGADRLIDGFGELESALSELGFEIYGHFR